VIVQDKDILWSPSEQEYQYSNMAKFALQNGFDPRDYDTLHRWSISDHEGFWRALWQFADVIGTPGTVVLERDQNKKMFGSHWFPDARLNFAENLLRGDDKRLAVVTGNEQGESQQYTMKQLRDLVRRVRAGLVRCGVSKGDRVGGVMSNDIKALAALLACASIGAVWVSCSTDIGIQGITDRIGQVEPKVLIATRTYRYNGKNFICDEKILSLLDMMGSVETLVLTDSEQPLSLNNLRTNSLTWAQLCSDDSQPLVFERLPFSHPLYIMFTSGTTGLPKGIVHSAGGVLLQHLKEHILHCDVKNNDLMFWYTNISWMMYHWLISGLASKAAIFLYDGAPILKAKNGFDYSQLWKFTEQYGITHFGTSPNYIAALQEGEYSPGKKFKLGNLRSILSAGAPVMPEQFDWLYSEVKKDMIFASISGGTEILGCFVLGAPILPVRRGQITCKALGHAVHVLDERWAPIIGEKGELSCTEPFPSAPLTFWGENGNERYYDEYFAECDDIWVHGDLAEQTPYGTLVIYGRTDTTLKPSGIRIGTAEIYRVLDTYSEIKDYIVFGLPIEGDEIIVLCLVLQDGITIDEDFAQQLKQEIRHKASPRHIPHQIHQVSDVPYTLNGKRVEGAVRAIATGKEVKNIGSLRNPECLDEYKNIFNMETLS